MSLNVGDRLGHYDVTALIGEGGMGQVYQATDTKLKRQVALKILPEAFAADPERLARFQREAEVLASLNHPNIAQIHGLEEADGIRALVLELVEGPTLADRIKQGPIPLDEALPIAKQIAEALEAAHEQGVVHRDLKPANVKVKDDGTVKVLDFGLAKALDPNPTGDPSQSPTLTAAATQMGVIMGTAAYMSPEQARGKTVDKRADIWAFGCVVFEMLTAKKAFEGDDVSLTLAKVLEREPSWESLPDTTPPHLRNVLQRCLEKEPRQRVQATGDVRLAMEGAFDVSVAPIAEGPRSGGLSMRPVAVAVLSAAVACFATWFVLSPDPLRTAPSGEPTHLPVATPPDVLIPYEPASLGVAISPQGTRVVYVGSSHDRRLYVQRLDQTGAVSFIAGTEEPGNPFFSPDGEWVGFTANGRLQKVALSGGPPVELADALSFRGAVWSPDGNTIYFVPLARGGIWKVPSGGGEAQRVTTPEVGSSDYGSVHWWPDVLPGGDHLVYTAVPQNQIMLLDIATEESTPLVDGYFARYLSTGHLVFARDDSLWAAPFDTKSLDIGIPIKVLDGIVTSSEMHAEFGVSHSGTLVYLSGVSDFKRRLVRVDRTGTREHLAVEAHPNLDRIDISPDGQRLALSMAQGPGAEPRANISSWDVYVYDLVRGTFDRLTADALAWSPVWTADGMSVVFNVAIQGEFNFYARPADRSAPRELLYASPHPKWAYSWSSDGRFLAFGEEHPETGADVWIYSADQPERAESFRAEPFLEEFPAFSPDGNWLAYQSNELGVFEVYVTPYPGPGPTYRVSTAGGEEPRWSADGTELFYRQGTTAMVVNVADHDFARAEPRALFTGLEKLAWDVSPAGDFFVTFEQREPPQLHIILNWTEELRALVDAPE